MLKLYLIFDSQDLPEKIFKKLWSVCYYLIIMILLEKPDSYMKK